MESTTSVIGYKHARRRFTGKPDAGKLHVRFDEAGGGNMVGKLMRHRSTLPAKLKSIQTGYPLDPSGSCSPTCPICLSWNTKMKKDSIGTMQEIERRRVEEHW